MTVECATHYGIHNDNQLVPLVCSCPRFLVVMTFGVDERVTVPAKERRHKKHKTERNTSPFNYLPSLQTNTYFSILHRGFK